MRNVIVLSLEFTKATQLFVKFPSTTLYVEQLSAFPNTSRPPIKVLSPIMSISLLVRPTLRSPLALGLGVTAVFATHQINSLRRPLLCDASPAARVQDTFRTYTAEAKVPVFKNGRPNPAAYRQISAGSIIGVQELLLDGGMNINRGD